MSDARSWRWLCSVANEVEVVAVDPVSQEPNTQPPHMLYTGVPVDEHVGAMAVAVRARPSPWSDRLLVWHPTVPLRRERRIEVEEGALIDHIP